MVFFLQVDKGNIKEPYVDILAWFSLVLLPSVFLGLQVFLRISLKADTAVHVQYLRNQSHILFLHQQIIYDPLC